MAATMFSKVLGFLRELVLANFYGTGMYADVFVLTLNIPGLIIASHRFCSCYNLYTYVL